MPLVNIKSKHYKERPACEFSGLKLKYCDDYAEFKMDDLVVNKSVENAS